MADRAIQNIECVLAARPRGPGSGDLPRGGCGAVRGVAIDGCNCLPCEQDTMSDRKAVVKNADMSGASLLFWRPLILGRLARQPLVWSLAPIARAFSLPICWTSRRTLRRCAYAGAARGSQRSGASTGKRASLWLLTA